MLHRMLIVGLVMLVAAVVAIPAVGAPGPLDLAKRAFSVGKKAERKAKAADKRARQARKVANRAQRSGRQANAKGKQALAKSNQALAILKDGVPHAKTADSANEAKSLSGVRISPIQVQVATSASAETEDAARSAAKPITLFSQGPLTVYAKCFAEVGNPDNPGTIGEIYIDTTAEGVLVESNEYYSNSDFLNPGVLEKDRRLLSRNSFAGPGHPGTINTSDFMYSAMYALAPGLTLQAEILIATKVGSPPAGNGVFGPTSDCIFAGTFTSY